MNSGRYFHNLVMLPTGKVFAVGGATQVSQYSTSGVLQSELWDPDTGNWSATASQTVARLYHGVAMLLPDGRVLSAGSGRLNPIPNQLNAQIYSPPYLFKGPRPTITSAPTAVAHGTAFTLASPDDADITSVTLVNLSTVTHTVDMSQTFRELPFTKTANQLTVTSPLTTDELPAGSYMVFAVNSNGVPSEAKIIKFSPAADSTAPTVSLTAPNDGATVLGTAVNLTATAADNIAVAGVQFKVDGNNVGVEDTTAPYGIDWNTTITTNGTHSITAVARDAAGNQTTSQSVSVVVDNPPDTTAPVITSVQASAITSSSAVIGWNTDELSDSRVEYGTTSGYGSTTNLNTVMQTSHSQTLSGLSLNTLYHYRVISRDASSNTATSGDFTFTTSASNPLTITFDDISGQNQLLPTNYPSGVITWASGQWYHSGPWQQFSTKSISFNGSTQTNGSFSFTAPKRLVSLQAFNGGSSTTITVACAGNPNKVVVIPAGSAITTITTGWSVSCSSVTITSSNGWNTNFDNVVIE
jgi:hypothetical protein